MAYANAADSTYAASVASAVNDKINTYRSDHSRLLKRFLDEANFERRAILKDKMAELGANIKNLEEGLTEMGEMLISNKVFTFNKIDGDTGETRIEGNVIVMDIAENGV